jgi:hypothetical protein
MRFRYANDVDCDAIGSRVSIRRRDPDGRPSDVVGLLEGCSERDFTVRDRRGRLITIERDRVIASRIVRRAAE